MWVQFCLCQQSRCNNEMEENAGKLSISTLLHHPFSFHFFDIVNIRVWWGWHVCKGKGPKNKKNKKWRLALLHHATTNTNGRSINNFVTGFFFLFVTNYETLSNFWTNEVASNCLWPMRSDINITIITLWFPQRIDNDNYNFR